MRVRLAACAAVACISACVHAQTPALVPAAATPNVAKAKASLAALRGRIDSVVDQSQFRNAMWGALIVDPERGDTLYSRNAGKLFLPASNQKLLTAAVALQALGPDFRFTTRVAMSGVQHDTILTGDIVVFGTGDPSFSDRIRGDAMIPLHEMADSLRARGIRRVEGRLKRGKPVFTDAPVGFGWAWDDLSATYGATVGDLMFNDAFTPVRIEFDGIPDTLPPVTPRYRNFLEAFNSALYDRGVYVRLSYDWRTPAPDSALTTLFTYQSAPLSELLQHFTKPSQNQIGEILLKTLGLVRTGAGRADSGASFITRQLMMWGADSGGFVVHDGSGLSRHDYVSPETVVRVLDAARRDSTFPVFYAALPVAAVDGTLDRRFHGTAAAGNVHAKTGSMDRVRALSGYVTTADGHMLEFSLIANGWTSPNAEIEAALDNIVTHLATLRLQR